MFHYYLRTDVNEGIATHWCHNGDPCTPRNLCTLCKSNNCTTPELETYYKDGIWYLNLGGTTRYADVAGRTKSKSMHAARRNPIYFDGNCAVMHLGAESGATDTGDRFLLFDRQHIHRVVAEIKRGNSVSAESYFRKPRHQRGHKHEGGKMHDDVHSHAPESKARARWCKPTLTGKSLLFHRWLYLTSPEEESCFKCIEHLNDLALDCRETNLLKAETVDGNNNQIHLLKQAFLHGGCTEVGSAAEAMQVLQQPYRNAVRSAPLLPDCVFRKKRVVSGKRKRTAKNIPSKCQRTFAQEPIIIL